MSCRLCCTWHAVATAQLLGGPCILLGWPASQRRKPIMGLVLFFNPDFFQAQSRDCFQAAAKNIRLMTGWDPSLPDSANSCCCFSAHQSVQNSSSKHSQTALWQLAAKSHAQTTCYPQKSPSANSQGHQLQAGFLASLPACPPSNTSQPHTLLHYAGLGEQASKGGPVYNMRIAPG